MFRKLFGRRDDDDQSASVEPQPTPTERDSTNAGEMTAFVDKLRAELVQDLGFDPSKEGWIDPDMVSVSISTGHDNEHVNNEWVDPRNSEWSDYEDFFFKDKSWYRESPQWRQVLRVCHAHWNLDRAIGETYYRREIDGVEPTIPLCRQQIAIAPQAKVAIEMHEKFEYDFRTKEIERERAKWKELAWGDYVGWDPILRPFKLPEHTGFKQLAIIYDKMKDYQSAIDVCQEALAVDWDGDWDVRIARYEKRLATASKKKTKKDSPVSGNVVTIDDHNDLQSKPKFCTNCGSNLEGATNFCPDCGSRI